MNENELHERYIRLAFQYESAIDALLARGLVDEEAADAAKERFYDTLNEEKLRTTSAFSSCTVISPSIKT